MSGKYRSRDQLDHYDTKDTTIRKRTKEKDKDKERGRLRKEESKKICRNPSSSWPTKPVSTKPRKSERTKKESSPREERGGRWGFSSLPSSVGISPLPFPNNVPGEIRGDPE